MLNINDMKNNLESLLSSDNKNEFYPLITAYLMPLKSETIKEKIEKLTKDLSLPPILKANDILVQSNRPLTWSNNRDFDSNNFAIQSLIVKKILNDEDDFYLIANQYYNKNDDEIDSIKNMIKEFLIPYIDNVNEFMKRKSGVRTLKVVRGF